MRECRRRRLRCTGRPGSRGPPASHRPLPGRRRAVRRGTPPPRRRYLHPHPGRAVQRLLQRMSGADGGRRGKLGTRGSRWSLRLATPWRTRSTHWASTRPTRCENPTATARGFRVECRNPPKRACIRDIVTKYKQFARFPHSSISDCDILVTYYLSYRRKRSVNGDRESRIRRNGNGDDRDRPRRGRGGRTTTAIEEINDAAADIAVSAQEISDMSGDQAANLTEVASEMSNLSATVEEIASGADEVRASSEAAERRANRGRESADEAIEAMEVVDSAASEVGEDFETLQEARPRDRRDHRGDQRHRRPDEHACAETRVSRRRGPAKPGAASASWRTRSRVSRRTPSRRPRR